jgi:adenylylsulfate kinase-like enzyme
MQAVPVLIISGPVGVGKTSVALEIADLLGPAGVRHAVVDLDALTWCFPRPADDRHHQRLGLRNLAAIWQSYRAAGAERLVIARVVSSHEELDAYRAAVPGAAITVVRLRASPETLRQRVERREIGLALEKSLRRTLELAAELERARAEDHVVDTDERSVTEVARAVLAVAGWWPPEPKT